MVEREQEAQVARDRLLGRDRRRDHRADLALGLVDPAVADDDRERARRRRGATSASIAARIWLLDEGAHPQDVVLDLAHLAVERARGARWIGRTGVGGSIGRGRLDVVEDAGEGVGDAAAIGAGSSVMASSCAQPNRPET